MAKLKYSSLFTYCVAWSVVGFPFLALLTNSLGLPSTGFSIAFRTLAAGSAAILMLSARLLPNRMAVTLFLTFWSIYFFRLYLATVLGLEELRRPNQFYWIWAFGACFLPAMAVLMCSNTVALDRLYNWMLTISTIAVLVALATATTSFTQADGSIVDYNRLSVESLNPISMGHLGVTAALLGISYFLSDRFSVRYPWGALAAVGLGLTTTMLANSRGPLVALAICILLLILGGARHKKTYLMISVMLTALVFIIFRNADLILSEGGILSRFSSVSSLDTSTLGRVIAYKGAVNQFLESPLFGDAVEEKNTGFYPHNVILEAFMSTGLAGGIPFFAFTVWALSCAWRLVRSRSRHLWVGLLATQYLAGAMLSGAIYTSHAMWVLLALTICLQRTESSKVPSS